MPTNWWNHLVVSTAPFNSGATATHRRGVNTKSPAYAFLPMQKTCNASRSCCWPALSGRSAKPIFRLELEGQQKVYRKGLKDIQNIIHSNNRNPSPTPRNANSNVTPGIHGL